MGGQKFVRKKKEESRKGKKPERKSRGGQKFVREKEESRKEKKTREKK